MMIIIIILNPKEEAFTLWAAASGCWCCWTFSNLAIMMAMIDSSSPREELSVYSRIRIFTCAKAFSNILSNTCPPPIIIFSKQKTIGDGCCVCKPVSQVRVGVAARTWTLIPIPMTNQVDDYEPANTSLNVAVFGERWTMKFRDLGVATSIGQR